ncbi:MAG: hypothetical protein CME62_03890 [Halobacteriovoraceae bacterium]|nr:hypothetical protein [Halobacteriovoraceae bacterium]|tara:strand:+ start:4360 stop:4683 length:324 start_codon:yes stop_codon:yes gene_type:complete
MSFKFTKNDNVNELPDPIKENLPHFIDHRVKEFEEVAIHFRDGDLEKVRNYCHSVRGIAASYNFHKLDEIITHFQDLAKNGDKEAIRKLIPIYTEYLKEMQSYIQPV